MEVAADPEAAAGGGGGGGTLGLRLMAMGVIAVVSLCGCGLPATIYYFHTRRKQEQEPPSERLPIFSLLKCFAAGVILGVGLVHVLPDAHEMISQAQGASGGGYPWAFVMALTGILLIVAMNQIMEIVFRRVYGLAFDSQEQHEHDAEAGEAGEGAAAAAEERRDLLPPLPSGSGAVDGPAYPPPLSGGCRVSRRGGSGHSPPPHHHHDGGDEEAAAAHSSLHLPYYSARYGSLGHAPPRVSSIYPNDPSAAAARRSASCYDYHESLLAGAPVAAGAGGEEADAATVGARHCHHHTEERHIVAAFQGRSVLTATMMELGIIFHSILIGLGLGVITTDRDAVLGLTLAVSCHQLFEGMGLATVILEAAASLPRRRIALLFLIFSLTTPAGIGLGILLSASSSSSSSSSPTTASRGALLLEGGLNGLASGVLISLGLQDMLVSELHQRKAQGSPGMQGAMLLAALGGALAMDALAVWA